ncbi:MAG: energy transducer TonB [Flammeovirgaceae bacterium]|nr:energy transducer TonB [Flammeovirgaceae bacterium]MBE63620.1 energy transducer TonB [Flammeovirgaceae bacterium]MBR10186.1 energy transducer TonB [Rickettsiales bacterium]HCX21371.1 energy transducer TonB [Cytophagales bacterium]
MRVKRERQALEIERKPLFFFIGLSLSLLFVIVAFNWKTYDKTNLVDLGQVNTEFDEVLDMPLSQQLPPPPPKKNLEVFELKEVEDEVLIEDMDLNLDMEMTEDLAVEDVVYEDLGLEVEEEVVEEIFQVVETWPEPDGGMASFYSYVADNMEYPEMARRLNISGVVFVQFVVEKDGSITDVKVVKGIGAGCDEEAVRVVSGAPAWHPGKQRGMPVRVYRTVPIRFILRER